MTIKRPWHYDAEAGKPPALIELSRRYVMQRQIENEGRQRQARAERIKNERTNSTRAGR